MTDSLELQTEERPVEQVAAPESSDFSADTRPSISQVKKRRGRPPKSLNASQPIPVAAAPCSVFSANYCGSLANLPFKLASDAFKIPELELDSDDKNFIGEPFAACLNELWPELMAKYPKWAMLGMSFAALASKKAVEVSLIKKLKAASVPKQTEEAPKSEPRHSFTTASDLPEPTGLTEIEMNLKSRLSGAN